MFNYERLEELMRQNHVTREQLLADLGFSKSWFTQIRNSTRSPSFTRVCMIADYFGVSTDFLRGYDYTPEDWQKKYRLHKYVFHTKLATEMALVKKIARDNNLPISEIKKNTPGYDDMRKLGYDIWKDDDKFNVTDL